MKKWRSYLAELFVIVLGITLSFLVNEWRTNIQDRNIEQDSLQTIYENLKMDTTRLGQGKQLFDQFGGFYQSFLDGTIMEKKDSVGLFLRTLQTYGIFIKTDVGYREMSESGNTRLIRDRELRYKLIELYTSLYPIAEEWNSIDRQFVLGEMIPYFNRSFPYSESYNYESEMGEPDFRALLSSDEFLNLVKTNLKFKQTQALIYEQAKVSATDLLGELESELK